MKIPILAPTTLANEPFATIDIFFLIKVTFEEGCRRLGKLYRQTIIKGENDLPTLLICQMEFFIPLIALILWKYKAS